MTNRYTRLTNQESTFGTDPGDGEQSYRVLENTHAYQPTENPIRTTESGLNVQRKERVQDISTGSIRMNVVLDKAFARWVAMLLGAESVSTEATTVGRHVFTPKQKITDSDTYPSWAMHKGIDIQERPYTGFGAERGTFSQSQQALLELALQTFSKKPGANTTLASLSDYSTQNYLSNDHVDTMTLGGSAVKFEDWSIEIDGPAMPAHTANGLDLTRIDVKPVNIVFNSTIRFLTDDQLENFLARTAQEVVIKLDSGVEIPSSSPSTNYSIEFKLHRLNLEDADVKPAGQERAMQVIGGVCEEDDDGDLIEITIDDDDTNAYIS